MYLWAVYNVCVYVYQKHWSGQILHARPSYENNKKNTKQRTKLAEPLTAPVWIYWPRRPGGWWGSGPGGRSRAAGWRWEGGHCESGWAWGNCGGASVKDTITQWHKTEGWNAGKKSKLKLRGWVPQVNEPFSLHKVTSSMNELLPLLSDIVKYSSTTFLSGQYLQLLLWQSKL